MPQLVFGKPRAGRERLDALAVSVEWLALNLNIFDCRTNTRVPERLQHGTSCSRLFFQSLPACL
ncbi:MAG TPA: hypothetical protein P5038_19210, partial [Candidatus Paceibacterota bacterium]|nr:hypothetical protein [Candidatus Paceibacterota bacterium]